MGWPFVCTDLHDVSSGSILGERLRRRFPGPCLGPRRGATPVEGGNGGPGNHEKRLENAGKMWKNHGTTNVFLVENRDGKPNFQTFLGKNMVV